MGTPPRRPGGRPTAAWKRTLIVVVGILLNAAWLLYLWHWLETSTPHVPSETLQRVDVVTEGGLPLADNEPLLTYDREGNWFVRPANRSFDLETRRMTPYNGRRSLPGRDAGHAIRIPWIYRAEREHMESLEVVDTSRGAVESRWRWEKEPWFVAVGRPQGLIAVGLTNTRILLLDATNLVPRYTLPGTWGAWTATFLHRRPGLAVSYVSRPVDSYEVVLWNVATGVEEASFRGHTARVVGLESSPDDTLLATVGLDETLRVWETATGKELWRVDFPNGAPLSVAFSHDGRLIAVGDDSSTVSAWKATGPERVAYWRLDRAVGRAGPSSITVFQEMFRTSTVGYSDDVKEVHAVAFSRRGGLIVARCGQHSFVCKLPLGW